MDLRYGVPPVLNLIFLLFFSTQSGSGMWDWNLIISSIFVLQFSFLELAFLLLTLMFLLLFLFTSAHLPIILNPVRIHLRAGDFSIALTTSLVASLFFPPSLFWPLHLLIVFSSPCHYMFFHFFKHFLGWFSAHFNQFPLISSLSPRTKKVQPQLLCKSTLSLDSHTASRTRNMRRDACMELRLLFDSII
ncbi:hypothetical protein QQP08_008602 [Theobroma cacao]|nr:hypothetical protein QQP08_008602 [Theobroma cacao]